MRLPERETDRLEDIEVVNRPKMSREDRAKQFVPFAALKGYPEALRKKEKEIEAQKEKRDDIEG